MQRLRIQLLEKQKVPPEEMRTVRRKQKREIESGIGFPAPPPAEPPSLNGAPPELGPEQTGMELRPDLPRENSAT